jgi:neurexin
MLQVGCDGHLWKQHMQLIQQLKQQARDGTLSEVLQQPIVGWHVKTEVSSTHRERREVGISQDVDYSISAALKYSWVDQSCETGVMPTLLLA